MGVATGVSEHGGFTIGASYSDGRFTPICTPGFTADCTSPTLYGKASLKALLGPEVATTLYDLAGPTVDVDGYGAFDVDSTATPWWMLHGGLEGSMGFDRDLQPHDRLLEPLADLLRPRVCPSTGRLDSAADADADADSNSNADKRLGRGLVRRPLYLGRPTEWQSLGMGRQLQRSAWPRRHRAT